MAISPQFKDELRARVKLSDFIGRKINVTRAGREFKACCPFHNEKTPSFTINDQKGFYHCFGCGAHGDVITFAMQHGNLPFMEALEVLAAEAGMSVPKPSPKEQEAYKKRDRLVMACEAASKWFSTQLHKPEHKDVMDYLLGRGLSEDVIASFNVGYAPNDMDALRVSLQQQGFNNNELIEAGILKQGKTGKEPYAFFRDRVMFPVKDRRGRVVAFGGRVLPDNIRPPDPRSDFTPPKYINTGETPIFHKGQMVYGMSLAREAASNGHSILLVEGYMDAIALHQAGFKAAVAPLGTALTEQQVMLCWQMIPDDMKAPILCFDGDNAGKRAAFRAVERVLPILKPNHSLKFLFLPGGEDPDSFIKAKGKGAFRSLLEKQTKNLVDVVWEQLLEGKLLSTPEARAGLNTEIDKLVGTIQDRDVQYYYKTELRNRVFQHFRNNQKNSFQKGRKQPDKYGNVSLLQPANLSSETTQKVLVAALINNPSLLDVYEEKLGEAEIRDESLDKCRQMLISAIAQESYDLHEMFESVGLYDFVEALLDSFSKDRRYNWLKANEDTGFVEERLNEYMRLAKTQNRSNVLASYAQEFDG